MNTENELLSALELLEKEKGISRDVLLDAIRQSLIQACKTQYSKNEVDNVVVNISPEDGTFEVYAEKTVVEEVEDPLTQISLADARMKDPKYELGDIVRIPIQSRNFGRIVTQAAKNVILQRIREEELRSLYRQYYEKEHEVLTGTVLRYVGNNVSVNLGKVEALLCEKEMIRVRTRDEQGKDKMTVEEFYPGQRIKVYVMEVKDSSKGPRVLLSRTHSELVKRLFENEVSQIADGTVQIRGIAREAGSRTKMAVWSDDPGIDPVGACVGKNGSRVDAVVSELNGEKIDIITWDENPALLIENALSPAKVIYVMADPDDKTAQVVVPDNQLSLAIGKEGQNVRLVARLTGFKIDIKSETQARESGDLLEYESDYYDEYDDDEYYDEYDEEYADGEYEDGEYEDGEYAEGDYPDAEYAGEAYENEAYEGGVYEDAAGLAEDGSKSPDGGLKSPEEDA